MGRRPTILTDMQLRDVEKLATVGCTWDQIAAFLGIQKRTVQRNAKAKEAYANGSGKGIAAIAAIAYRNAASGDQRAVEFFLRTRGGWREGVDAGMAADTNEDRHLHGTIAVEVMQRLDRLAEVEVTAIRDEPAKEPEAAQPPAVKESGNG